MIIYYQLNCLADVSLRIHAYTAESSRIFTAWLSEWLSPESTVACLPRLTHLRRPQSHRSSCSRDVMNASSCFSRKRREAPPWCSRSLRCFWTLCCVEWCLATDVSGQYTGPVVKSQATRKHFFFWDFFTFEEGADILSGNFDNHPQSSADNVARTKTFSS